MVDVITMIWTCLWDSSYSSLSVKPLAMFLILSFQPAETSICWNDKKNIVLHEYENRMNEPAGSPNQMMESNQLEVPPKRMNAFSGKSQKGDKEGISLCTHSYCQHSVVNTWEISDVHGRCRLLLVATESVCSCGMQTNSWCSLFRDWLHTEAFSTWLLRWVGSCLVLCVGAWFIKPTIS